MENMKKLHEELEEMHDLAKKCAQEATDEGGKMLCKVTEEVIEALEEQFDRYLGESEEE